MAGRAPNTDQSRPIGVAPVGRDGVRGRQHRLVLVTTAERCFQQLSEERCLDFGEVGTFAPILQVCKRLVLRNV